MDGTKYPHIYKHTNTQSNASTCNIRFISLPDNTHVNNNTTKQKVYAITHNNEHTHTEVHLGHLNNLHMHTYTMKLQRTIKQITI